MRRRPGAGRPVAALVAVLVALPSRGRAPCPSTPPAPADLLGPGAAPAPTSAGPGSARAPACWPCPTCASSASCPRCSAGPPAPAPGGAARRRTASTSSRRSARRGLVVDAAGSWTWDSERRRAVRLDGAPAVRLPRAADLVAPLLGRRLARTPGLRPQPLGDRRVAGFATAGLRLVPGTGTPTTVSAVDLWVEPRTGLPLRVEVRARGVRPAGAAERAARPRPVRRPTLVRVAFSPPPDADVRLAEVADLAAAADRFARTVLPEALAGQARDPRRGRRSAGSRPTAAGSARSPSSRCRATSGAAVLRRLDEDDTDGRADVRTPLLNAAVVRVRGGVLVARRDRPARGARQRRRRPAGRPARCAGGRGDPHARPDQALRPGHRRRRRRPRRPRGRPLRLPRPQRLGQDDDGAHAARPGAPDVGGGRAARRAASATALPQVGALVEGPAFVGASSGRTNLRQLDAAGPGGDRRTRRRRVEDVLEQVGLAGVGRRPVRAYSLGMRQRLGPGGGAAARPAAAGARRADQRPGPAGHPRGPRPAARAEPGGAPPSSCPATCWPRSSSCAPGSACSTAAGWCCRAPSPS